MISVPNNSWNGVPLFHGLGIFLPIPKVVWPYFMDSFSVNGLLWMMWYHAALLINRKSMLVPPQRFLHVFPLTF